MKNRYLITLIFSVLLLLTCMCTNAQIKTWKVEKTSLHLWQEGTWKLKTTFTPRSLYITEDEGRITIFADTKVVIYPVEEIEGKRSELFTTHRFSAYDMNGQYCTLMFTKYSDRKNLMYLILMYDNECLTYVYPIR